MSRFRRAAESKSPDADWAGPLHQPRPELRQLQARARRKERGRLAEERWLARMGEATAAETLVAPPPEEDSEAETGAPSGTELTAQVQEVGQGEVKAPAPGSTAGTVRRGPKVNLTSGAIGHILRRHGRAGDPWDSRFAERYWDGKAMRELIRTALAEAAAFGTIIGLNGNHLTFCRVPEVGRTGRLKGWKETDRMLVVTSPFWNGEEYEHDLETAYPVP